MYTPTLSLIFSRCLFISRSLSLFSFAIINSFAFSLCPSLVSSLPPLLSLLPSLPLSL